MKKTAYLIAGATASGKSMAAINLAKKLNNSAIINADSMQVYKDLAILTARPNKNERQGIDHFLLGNIDGSEHYSVGKWLKDAKSLFINELSDTQNIIFVGGTGLYFKCALEGISPIPNIPESLIKKYEALWEKGDEDKLRNELIKIDPKLCKKIKVLDKQRVIRGICVYEYTGKPLSTWQEEPNTPSILQDFDKEIEILLPERTKLYKRINDRFDIMMENGAISEVEALLERSLNPDLPVMRAIGVKEISAFLKGDISKEACIEKAKQASRNYAKRQYTWFKKGF